MQARRLQSLHPLTRISIGTTFACLALALGAWYVIISGNGARSRPVLSSSIMAEEHAPESNQANLSTVVTVPSKVLTPPQSEQLIVAAHYHEELSWVSNMTVPVKLIDKDDPTNPDNVGSNNMTESTSYLYYIIKYYDTLPKVIAFVHGHGDLLLVQQSVWNVDKYTALPHPETLETCNTQHEQQRGAVVWFGGPTDQPNDTSLLDHYSAGKSDHPSQYQRAFHELFAFLRLAWAEGGMGMRIPNTITTLCCSTFSISKAALKKVPREKYVRLFDFLESGSNPDWGVPMEYVWIVLFNEATWT